MMRCIERLKCLAVGLCLVVAGTAAGAETVLRYPGADAAVLASGPTAVQSAFHTDEATDAEAARLVAAWTTDPVTIPWTRIQLARYVKHKMMPTRGARGLALVHVAMHDALVLAARRRLDQRLAVSMAAAQVLGYLFVAEERAFDRIALRAASRLSGRADGVLSEAQNQALALGAHVGGWVVKYAETDGAQKGWNGVRLQYYGENRYYGPGTWEPTPPYFYYPPDEPFAPGWRLWVLKSADEYRPIPPPYGSPRYLKDLEEVVQVTRDLTDDQRRIARFWVDGYGSVTPPGHWNDIAADIARTARLDDGQTAKLFAQMNIAMADTFIAVWDVKYHYWTARPITSAKYVLGMDFRPTLLTPPFPSYVSGHAGFSGAAAHVIGAFVPAQATAVNAMADEAAHSRLLGGIHYRHDNDDGLALGRKVAQKVLQTFPR